MLLSPSSSLLRKVRQGCGPNGGFGDRYSPFLEGFHPFWRFLGESCSPEWWCEGWGVLGEDTEGHRRDVVPWGQTRAVPISGLVLTPLGLHLTQHPAGT